MFVPSSTLNQDPRWGRDDWIWGIGRKKGSKARAWDLYTCVEVMRFVILCLCAHICLWYETPGCVCVCVNREKEWSMMMLLVVFEDWLCASGRVWVWRRRGKRQLGTVFLTSLFFLGRCRCVIYDWACNASVVMVGTIWSRNVAVNKLKYEGEGGRDGRGEKGGWWLTSFLFLLRLCRPFECMAIVRCSNRSNKSGVRWGCKKGGGK